MSTLRTVLLISTLIPLAACGADDVASPGEGVIVAPPGQPGGGNPPPPPPPPSSGPAADCPTGFSDAGVIGNHRACRLPNAIVSDLVVPARAGTAYMINGRVDVGVDVGGAATPASTGRSAILTVQPGAILFGNGGDAENDFLVINRGSRIEAVGSADKPIIFTSRENVAGTSTDTTQGEWGGVILAGRAPISNCNTTVTGGTAACQNVVEGTGNALYGGEVANDNSGNFRYVQIRYSGVAISQGNELQGLTLAGVGSNTTIDHVQIHNSADDGIEVFGGRVNAKYLIMTGTDDDALDTDVGHKGAFQFVLGVQRAGNGSSDPRGFEINSNGSEDALPRTDFRVANYTLVQRLNASNTANSAGIHLRGGTDATLMNGVVVHSGSACLNIDGQIPEGETDRSTVRPANPGLDERGPPQFNSNYFACTAAFVDESNVTGAQINAILTSSPSTGNVQNGTAANAVTNTFVTGNTGVTAFNASSANFAGSTFLVSTNFIGAVRDANDTWYRGWSCNSATASFGSSAACTALPNGA